MRSNVRLLCALALSSMGVSPALAASYSMVRVGRATAPSGVAEIVSFDAVNRRLYTTNAGGLEYFKVGPGGGVALKGAIDLGGTFPAVSSVASVAIDPLGRGFGAASVIPEPNDGAAGAIVLFDTATNAVIKTLSIGFNPDSVSFTPDGMRVVVADEGEPNTVDPDGSLSILDLSGVASAGDVGGLTQGQVGTFDFRAPNLGAGVTLDGLRINPANAGNRAADMEPEYVAADNDGVWVSLQENNALARFDFASQQWTTIHNLGGIDQTVDASDRDGGAFIDDVVRGLFMPDAIASYEVAGTRYVLTANEGDARDGEEVRFKDANIDPTVLANLNALYGGNAKADAALGRLTLSAIDGDTDGDGDIDVPTMYGTRSFTIWNAETGGVVFDSGSDFESITAATMPTIFNSEGTVGTFDGRSDNKGPEPEGMELGVINGRTFAFIGLERIGGVMMYDVTDPENSFFVDYLNTALEVNGGLAPEGLDFFEMDGRHYLAVSYEVSGTVEVFRIVPAPGAMALVGMAGLASLRRRR